MRVAILNKSDARGGAAVVTMRLLLALREAGVDARMIVCEKLTDSPYVYSAASPWQIKRAFFAERARVFAANGFDRATLFKTDPCTDGLPLWRHPIVKGADIVMLNWVNQGMLSLKGIARIASEKPIVWTMHDMWCATGICHHAGSCERFRDRCGVCPLLGKGKGREDLSAKVHRKKMILYERYPMHFVAVSNWLKEKCAESSLLREGDVNVIPNPFPIDNLPPLKNKPQGRIRAVVAAARLDDDVKGFPILLKALKDLSERHRDIAERLEIVYCGNIKDRTLLESTPVVWEWKGTVAPSAMPEIFQEAHLVLSSSLYETLPGTLIEGQAYGALPIAFDRGGQRDIIDSEGLGVLASFGENEEVSAKNFADAIVAGINICDSTDSIKLASSLRESVITKFSSPQIARQYLSLLESILIKKG